MTEQNRTFETPAPVRGLATDMPPMTTSQPLQPATAGTQPSGSASPGLTATSAEISAFSQVTPDQKAHIEQLLQEIDLADSNSIVLFGARAQGELTNISEQMLEGVKNKDAGPAGDALSRMLLTLKGFDTDDLKESAKRSWIGRLFGGTKPIHKFVQKYQEVRGQIETIGDSLNKHKNLLMIDVEKLDRLYDATLSYFHQLALYISAGDELLRKLDEQEIPLRGMFWRRSGFATCALPATTWSAASTT
jgi:uncharacterized protein YaaN involved in tellurite resistance